MIEQIGNSLTCVAKFSPLTTGLTVTCDVYNPAGTKIVSAAAATEIGTSGVYKYTLASGSVTTAGLYLFMFNTSSTAVDYKNIEAGWFVGSEWVEDIDDEISNVPPLVWAESTRSLTDKTNYALTTSEKTAIGTAVWATTTRTLTSFGTLVDDMAAAVWAAATRTLTAFGFTVATDTASRDASKADVSALATSAEIAALNDISATDVWTAGTRTLTDPNSYKADVSALATSVEVTAVDAAVWSYGTRTLTSAGAGGATAQEVWEYTTRELTAGTKDTEIDAIKTKTDGLPADTAQELTDIDNAIAAIGPGSGANEVTLQVYKTATTEALSSVSISIYSGADLYASGVSDVAGQFTVNLDDGTYSVRMTRVNTSFATTESLVVSGATSQTYYGSLLSIPSPAEPSNCVLYDDMRGINSGEILTDVSATIKIVSVPYDYAGFLFVGQEITMDYDNVTGRLSIEIVRGAVVEMNCPAFKIRNVRKTIPEAASARWSDL